MDTWIDGRYKSESQSRVLPISDYLLQLDLSVSIVVYLLVVDCLPIINPLAVSSTHVLLGGTHYTYLMGRQHQKARLG